MNFGGDAGSFVFPVKEKTQHHSNPDVLFSLK